MEEKFFYDDIPGAVAVQKINTNYSANTNFHMHSSFEIYLFLQGNVNCWVDKSLYNLRRGTLLIFNNQEIHRIVNPSPALYERLVIHFQPKIIQSFNTEKTNLLSCFLDRANGENNAVLLPETKIDHFISLAKKLNDSLRDDQYGSDVLTLTYLVELLVFINRLHQGTSETFEQLPLSKRLQGILKFIEDNLANDLSLDKISHHFSIDKYYLARHFKKETGCTIYNYILLKRISLAKKLLSEGNNVSETCLLSGFNDYANFIRAFKKITGCSPSKYKTHFQR